MDDGMAFWQIGSEGGFLPDPVRLSELPSAPAALRLSELTKLRKPVRSRHLSFNEMMRAYRVVK